MKIDEAPAKHPWLTRIAQLLIPSKAAANYLAKMKLEAEAIEPPYKPYAR